MNWLAGVALMLIVFPLTMLSGRICLSSCFYFCLASWTTSILLWCSWVFFLGVGWLWLAICFSCTLNSMSYFRGLPSTPLIARMLDTFDILSLAPLSVGLIWSGLSLCSCSTLSCAPFSILTRDVCSSVYFLDFLKYLGDLYPPLIKS